jgi:hypothetical protein
MTMSEMQAVHVDWTCRTPRGVTGRGKLDAQVPVAEGAPARADGLRGFVDAAFSAAVDEVGPEAGPKAVEAAMDRRLSALLPKDHRIVTLEVEAVETFVLQGRPVDQPSHAGSGPGARPAQPVKPGILGLFCLVAAGSCCLLMGVGGIGAGSDFASQKAVAAKAPVMTAIEAVKATGLVCVQGVTAQVDSALRIPGGEKSYLVLVETETTTEAYTSKTTRTVNGRRETVETEGERSKSLPATRTVVPRFRVGPLAVVTDGASWDGEKALAASRKSGASTFAYTGFDADQPLTIVGHVQAGSLGKGGEAFVISSQKSRDDLVAHLASLSTSTRAFGVVAALVGVAFFLGALMIVVRR